MRKLLLFVISITTYIFAQPNLCTTPISLASTGTYTAPISDTWYIFNTGTDAGNYTFTTCGLSTCDTKIYIYDVCPSYPYSELNAGTIGYNDDDCALQSTVTINLPAATNVYIRIGDYNTACGTSPIQWSFTYLGPITGCMDPLACNYNPLATVSDGSCIYAPNPLCPAPDLAMDSALMSSSLAIGSITVSSTDCRIEEGCLTGYGTRDLLRFSTKIDNIGTSDYFIGVPSLSNPQFSNDNCHGHWHYEGYAYYALYDMAGNELPLGYKNGFCVLDLGCNPGYTGTYGCGNMGISNGCYDIYSSGLDCQWVDITDVDTGIYQLVVRVNWDQDPDANGAIESTFDNNAAYVCVHFTRNALGVPNFSLVPDCPVYTDCMGVPFGTTEEDCNGICGGVALRGDLDNDTSLTQPDAVLYVNRLIDNTLPQVTCTDMNADGEWTVFDAALSNHCSYNGPSPTNNPCEFPHGIENNLDTVTLSIANVDFVNHFVDIAIKNPTHKVLAYQFEMSGIEIQSVVNSVDPLEYNITPNYAMNGTEVIGLSYTEMLINTNATNDELCRIYWSNITGTEICIADIVDIVNENVESTITVIGGDCFTVPGAAIEPNGSTIAISLFPNPTTDIVNIKIGNMQSEEVSIEVIDALGKVVLSSTHPDVMNETITLNTSMLSSGVYYVNVISASGNTTQKLIKK